MKIRDVIIDMHQGINTVADKVVYLNSGIPIIQSKNFTKGYLDLEDVRYLDEEDEKKYKEKYNPHVGDIMMANIGTIGKSYVIKEEKSFLIAWNVFLIKPDTEKVMSDFLKFYFDYLASTHYFDRLLTGGTVKFINKKKIADINVPNKSLAEQEIICNILSQVEKIIILKQKELKFLDDLIKARFVEMFKNKGYERVLLSKLVDCKVSSAKKDFIPEDVIKYIDITSIDNSNNKMTGYTEYVLKEAPSRAQQHILKNDIVVSTVRPNLKNVALNQYDYNNLIASSGFCVLRVKNNICPEYIKAIVCSDDFTNKMTELTTGANYPAIHNSDVMNYIVDNPPIELQNEFAEFVKQVDKSREIVQKKIDAYQELFDKLMQEYFG